MTFSTSPEFIRFLCRAKCATYAAQGDSASVPPLLPDTRQLEFREGPYFYRDIYVGMLAFTGQEVVYFEGQALWSMAYSGGLMSGVAKVDAPTIYQTLRDALCAVPDEMPVRGPATFKRQDLSYGCSIAGTITRFQGRETISRDGQVVYELCFAGGGVI